MTKIYWFLGHEQFQPEVLVKHAKLAEEVGFDGVMTSEHFNPWVDDVGAGGFAFSTLGAIAEVTKRVELMTAVTTPLWRYHPAVVAQAAATISRLSDGRFKLGVGTGENINEGPLGYKFGPYSERSARMREALTIMKRLLRGELVNFEGDYYQTKSAKLYSPPTGDLPIYLAAGGPKSATLAGELADGVIASVKVVQDTREKVLNPAFRAAKDHKKPKPVIVATNWTVYAKNVDEAWEALRAWRGLRAPDRLTEIDPAKLAAAADVMDRAEILSKYRTVTDAFAYIETYGAIISSLEPDILGIQTTSTDIESTIRMLGKEVLPELKLVSA